jgi:hypothetical protein
MSEDGKFALIVLVLLLSLAATVAWSLALRFRRRELLHREWMAALEKGMPLPDLTALEDGVSAAKIYLLKGLVWLVTGITLSIFLGVLWLTTWERPPVSALIRDAQALRELGYSQDEVRRLIPFQPEREPDFPIGLAVLGIVPAGVGVAYLLFYRGALRRLR